MKMASEDFLPPSFFGASGYGGRMISGVRERQEEERWPESPWKIV
jgi:hypothetical protein